IESDGGAFSAAKAPDGTQAAFLQSIDSGPPGQISQSVTLDPGTYDISFWAAQRQGYGVNPIQVQVDGQDVGSPISPASTNWAPPPAAPSPLPPRGTAPDRLCPPRPQQRQRLRQLHRRGPRRRPAAEQRLHRG